MTAPEQQTKPIVISPDHRRIAVDHFGLRLNDNLAQVILSIETLNEKGEEVIVREATAVLTLRSLKIFHLLLGNILERAERDLGPIEIPQNKLDELKAGKGS